MTARMAWLVRKSVVRVATAIWGMCSMTARCRPACVTASTRCRWNWMLTTHDAHCCLRGSGCTASCTQLASTLRGTPVSRRGGAPASAMSCIYMIPNIFFICVMGFAPWHPLIRETFLGGGRIHSQNYPQVFPEKVRFRLKWRWRLFRKWLRPRGRLVEVSFHSSRFPR